ncbi:hypothetical protein F9278_28010 [Streptomyces phaeolivaceus]|uniref:Uncharacterized protein n=1 Tax=Streptomyces phaeolivaceus TaxID=2653200 RepID=A0A5P8K988_9ACTN|nr:hypothetical protein [Streptomyces phaeolivaceus]QFQ99358.1 hypothetical protein F9278_28010 [Streptomyces phaeolivaceus]
MNETLAGQNGSEPSMEQSEAVRRAGEELLRVGGDCTTRAELLDYIAELAHVASAIRYGLINAAWRALLGGGAPLDQRPATGEVERVLSLRAPGADDRHPAESTFMHATADALKLAECLGHVMETAWTAGISDETRIAVGEARGRGKRDTVNRVMQAVKDGLHASLPADLVEETAAAIANAMRSPQKDKKDSASSAQDLHSGL